MTQKQDAEMLLGRLLSSMGCTPEQAATFSLSHMPQFGGTRIERFDGSVMPFGETRRPLVEFNRTLRFAITISGWQSFRTGTHG